MINICLIKCRKQILDKLYIEYCNYQSNCYKNCITKK